MSTLARLDARFGLLQQIGPVMIDLIGPIEIERGDTLSLRITVTNDTDAPIDLTGMAIELEVKSALGGADPAVIAKAIGTGITILTQGGTTLGQADVDITSTDTNIAAGLYFLDVVTVDGVTRNHVIKPREFTVRDVVNAP